MRYYFQHADSINSNLSSDARVAAKKAEIRSFRTGILYRTDWTQVADAALTEEQVLECREYRSLLRDSPDLVEDAEYVDLPDPPVYLQI